MTESAKTFPVKPHIAENAKLDTALYERMYEHSVADPEGFWREHGQRLDWMKPYSQIRDVDFADNARIRWYYDGQLNVSANCIDRHLPERADQTAFIFEGDNPEDTKTVTYSELKDHVSQLANALKARGVKKGDRVTIYMPM